ncbi:hypothetical protein [Burkholderia sp. ABCPW 14]|nr:hypothetical protein [Burkholderia sp. ABCPW 14]
MPPPSHERLHERSADDSADDSTHDSTYDSTERNDGFDGSIAIRQT